MPAYMIQGIKVLNFPFCAGIFCMEESLYILNLLIKDSLLQLPIPVSLSEVRLADLTTPPVNKGNANPPARYMPSTAFPFSWGVWHPSQAAMLVKYFP